MVNMFEKNGVYIITLLPQNEEEAKFFIMAQKLADKGMDITEKEIPILPEEEMKEEPVNTEETNKNTQTEQKSKVDNDYEQMLLNL